MIKLTLGTDHAARKATPLLRACFGYFLAALAGVARHSVRSNKQHNGNAPVHWARGKSADHEECIFRHSGDIADIRAWLERNPNHADRAAVIDMLETELDARAWRALAESQEFYEQFRGAPSSPSSVLPPSPVITEDGPECRGNGVDCTHPRRELYQRCPDCDGGPFTSEVPLVQTSCEHPGCYGGWLHAGPHTDYEGVNFPASMPARTAPPGFGMG